MLALSDGHRDPPFLAFVRALRSLPAQQREAFVLHHGEHLNERYLGVAMDCSVLAAEAHLRVATAELRAVAGGDFAGLLTRFAAAYANLSPPPENAPAVARRYVARHVWPRRIVRLVRLLIALAVVGGLVVVFWRHRNQIEEYLPTLGG